jgi:hypothetical protein
VTLPAFRHAVQTFNRLGAPSTTARTDWMLGLNCRGDLPLMRRRRAFRPSRDTLLPNLGLLPQISQTADTETPIPYVIASGGRATKRSVVARAEVTFGAADYAGTKRPSKS